MRECLLEIYPYFGWAGSLVLLVGILMTALVYRGKEGERYAIQNHFISELGEVGVSRWAVVFNSGLIIGGLLFLVMIPGVGLAVNTLWGYLAAAAGVVTAVACVFVGIFPMNKIEPHTTAAMTYFRAGMVTLLLFCFAILLQPADQRVIPTYTLFFSLISFAAYAAFLVHAGQVARKAKEMNVLDTNTMKERPAFWWMPFLEWMVFFSTILWFLVISTVR